MQLRRAGVVAWGWAGAACGGAPGGLRRWRGRPFGRHVEGTGCANAWAGQPRKHQGDDGEAPDDRAGARRVSAAGRWPPRRLRTR